ncbi:hypothetical protein HOD29_00925 [archaeon]|jgi:hypothetical protein|nr:hypothetical protein [archaeon]
MPTKDTTEIKNKIISFLETRGPSLPVHIAREIHLDMLFTSAFLSELLSEKRLKITSMKVGSSPVYYLSGQEEQLEKYSEHLKSKEREAFDLLKDKRFLIDFEQHPAIRVALRAIPDFAKEFNREEKTIWRYFTIPEEEFKQKVTPLGVSQEGTSTSSKPQSSESHNKELPLEKTQFPDSIISDVKETLSEQDTALLDVSQTTELGGKKEPKEKPKKEKPKKKSTTKKKVSQKKNEKFFNTIKEYLSNKGIQIEDIETFSKDNLILKINENGEEKMLIAYNKKRITEEDIVKAYKKASESNSKFDIISLGEPAKKTTTLIEAIQNLSKLKKIE